MRIGFKVSGSGTPIVFTSGIAHTSEVWNDVLRGLEGCGRLLAWDHRGHGDSARSDEPSDYTASLAVSDLGAMIAEAGGNADNPAVLVGHSLGGYLSLRAAILKPDRVKALVLIATGPGFRDERAREQWNRFALAMPMPAPVHEQAKHLGLQSDAVVIESLPALKIPTLVIVGSEDRQFLSGSDYLLAKLPDATGVVIEGGRHSVHKTHPDRVIHAIKAFLTGRRLMTATGDAAVALPPGPPR